MAPVLAVAMVLDRLPTHKVVVSMVALEGDRIQWVVLETNDMEDGNSKQRERAQRLSCHMVWSLARCLKGSCDISYENFFT